ncbi:MAG: T9SS type A sorting domain-containing protein [Bacteroidia bacterium]
MKKLYALLFLAFFADIQAQNYYINNFAGNGVNNYNGDGGPATAAAIGHPECVAIGPSGNVYISDPINGVIRKVNRAQKIYTVGYTNSTSQFAINANELLYLTDNYDNKLCTLDTLGHLTYIAGTGNQGHTGDGGPATAAQLDSPNGLVLDKQGNIYFSETSYIRKIDINGIITTIAGVGTTGYSGDGGPATAAQLNNPYGLAMDTTGNLYIADMSNNCVRVIKTTGIITTIAGTGVVGYTGNGAAATAAQLNAPMYIAINKQGNLYISEVSNCIIRMVNTSGIINPFVGNHTCSTVGDGWPATSASLNIPEGICLDSLSNLYVCDNFGSRVRKVGYCAADISITVTGTTVTCGNTRTVLKATGATTYNWYSGSTHSSTDSLVLYPPTTTTIIVYGLTGSCPATATYTIQVTPSVTITASKTTICKGDTTTLTALGATSYLWLGGQHLATINVAPTSSTYYTVIASTGSCSANQNINIYVNPTPTVGIYNSNFSALYCPQSQITLNAVGAITYTWSANVSSVNTPSVSISPLNTATYSVVGTNTYGCVGKATNIINVVGTPTVWATPSTTVCPGTYVQLNATGPDQNCTWSTNVNYPVTTTVVTVEPQDTTTYMATFDYYDGFHTCYISDSITIYVPYVNISAGNNTNICLGDTVTVSPTSSSNTYTLTPGNISAANIALSPTVTTTYTITGSNAYCSNSKIMQVYVHTCNSDTIGNGIAYSHCENYDLTSGKFSGWFAQSNNNGATDSITNYGLLNLTGVDSSGYNELNHAHEVCNVGFDSLVSILPRINGVFSQSVRLGKDLAGFNHQTLSTTFKVGITDTNFVFSYAFVSDGHGLAPAAMASPNVHAEPYFQAKFFDANNQEITGTRFFYGAGAANPTGYVIANTPIYFGDSIIYQTWTAVHTNLSQYFGQIVTILFETSDCNEGAHFGYAYLQLGCPGSQRTSAIQNYTATNQLRLYPNPTKNKFTVEFSSTDKQQQLQLFDISGKLILQQNISGTTTIDATNLENGIYLVQLKNRTSIGIQKIIVQH